jgi:hypothetical protein
MWSAIFGLPARLLPMLFGRKVANLAEVADSNARAQERLGQQEAANEVLTKAGAARADADARIAGVLRSDSESAADALKREFPNDFRD